MKFTIKCETLLRLAGVCEYFDPAIEPDIHYRLNTVRLENVNGKCIAVVTNQKIAVVEMLGDTTEKNGFAHLVLDPNLLQQCRAESSYGGFVEIITVPEIAVATAKTMFGWAMPGNACHWFDDTPLHNWRDWGPDKPAAHSVGAMFWNLQYVEALLRSSPSGKVVFPEFIDVSRPVVVRDRVKSEWVGLFLAQPKATDLEDVKPAALPAWWGA